MRRTRRWLCFALTVGAVICMPTASGAEPPGGDGDARLKLFTRALEKDGFDVNAGLPTALNLTADWCSYDPDLEHASWTNNEPYVFLRLPRSVDEPETLVLDFQVRRDEAIVLIGTTPPPEKYFAFYTWLAKKVYADGQKRAIGSSAVDPVNSATIKTAGPTPFDAPVALIFTPDQGTDARVRAALRGAGYPDAMVNTVVFPESMLRFGHGDASDEFRITMRNAIWLEGHEEAGKRYVSQPADFLHIYRVTPQVSCSASACVPFPMPPVRVRGTGRTELYLWNKLDELRAGIIAAHPGLVPTDIPVVPCIGYEGSDYMQRGEYEGGDARDAFIVQGGYLPEFGTSDVIRLGDDEFFVVYGANHVATGKATYMNVNVYTGEEKDGRLSIGDVDDRMFEGTATPYLPHGDPEANLMYAYKISRRCGGEPRCLQLSAPEGCSRLTLDARTILGVIIRPYLEPATRIGAAMPEVLYDRLLKFSPRKRGPTREAPGTRP